LTGWIVAGRNIRLFASVSVHVWHWFPTPSYRLVEEVSEYITTFGLLKNSILEKIILEENIPLLTIDINYYFIRILIRLFKQMLFITDVCNYISLEFYISV